MYSEVGVCWGGASVVIRKGRKRILRDGAFGSCRSPCIKGALIVLMSAFKIISRDNGAVNRRGGEDAKSAPFSVRSFSTRVVRHEGSKCEPSRDEKKKRAFRSGRVIGMMLWLNGFKISLARSTYGLSLCRRHGRLLTDF